MTERKIKMGRKVQNPSPPYLADKDINELDTVKCPKCNSIHFRHTGNVMTNRLYPRRDKRNVGNIPNGGDVEITSHNVMVCVGCGTPWVQVDEQLFDASEEIDVKKFDKVSKALQDETHTDPHC